MNRELLGIDFYEDEKLGKVFFWFYGETK